MASPPQNDLFRRLSRHHHMLVGGGGLFITLIVLISCLLEVWAGTRAHLDALQDEASLDARQLADFKARVTANVRNNVQSIELALRSPRVLDAGVLDAFERGGRALRVQSTDDAQPLLVLARATTIGADDPWPYLQLAHRLSPLVSIAKERNATEHSIYLYGADGQNLLISQVPWPEGNWQGHLASERLPVIERLASGLEFLSTDTDSRSVSALHWLEPYLSPLTGKQALRIASRVRDSGGKFFGTVVYELPMNSIQRQLSKSGLSANYMIFDGSGRLLISSAGTTDGDEVGAAKAAIDAGLGRGHRRVILGGQVFYGWSLGASDWTLVYELSWRHVAQGLGLQLVIPILTAAVITILIWLFLLMIKRRVLAPAVHQSQRVFENEQLSRTLIQTAPVGLSLLVLPSGETLLRSPAMQAMQDRLCDKTDNLSDALAHRYQQHLAGVLDGARDEPLHDELTFVALNGAVLHLSISMAPARYQDRDVLVASFVDVTEKKQLERSLYEAKAAADNANAAKSAFLAAMSHEIRTPLNAILGNLELLAHSALTFQRDRLDTIRRSSDSLLAIISDVLDFSKIEAGELRLERIEFDLLDVASRSLAIFASPASAKNLLLHGELSDVTTWTMRGDPTRLGQVLNNLLSNAIKFTERGQVTLRIRESDAAALVMFEVEDSGIGMSEDQVLRIFQPFSQADETINRRYGGTGLGLTLCQRLIIAMGGELSVISEAGKGSLFCFSLPIETASSTAQRPTFAGENVLAVVAMADQRTYLEQVLQKWGLQVKSYQHPTQIDSATLTQSDALILWGNRFTWCTEDENRLVERAAWVIDCAEDGPREPTKAGKVLNASNYGVTGLGSALRHALQARPLASRVVQQWALTKTLKVLVAEDNLVNQRLFEEQLKLLGCEARVVEDGQRALECLEQSAFDVIITDLCMPIMDGFTLAKLVREKWPAMPIVAATANVTVQDQMACIAAGVNRVVTKPLSLSALEQALREVCGMRADTGSSILRSSPPVSQSFLPDSKELPPEIQLAFESSTMSSLESLKQAQNDGDETRIFQELHSLRGALSLFSLQALADQAADLDDLVRVRGSAESGAAVGAFCTALERLLAARSTLQSLISQLAEYAASAQDDASAVKARELCEELRGLSQRGADKKSPTVY